MKSEVCVEMTGRRPEDTQKIGRCIGELAQAGDVILLTGNLGAGKTCLTQGIAWGLGIQEYTMSPSFVLVRELRGRLPLYHIDLYRLEKVEESVDLGLDDYFYGRGLSVVEWADRAMSIMPPEHLLIEVEYLSDTGRKLRLKPAGRRYLKMAAQLRKTCK
jgi:tRNA threonylcarbamoyladenosine biosynthesis protein TsaE